MTAGSSKQLRWIRKSAIPAAPGRMGSRATAPRERLVAALADRPRTVAQLAHLFGVAQPTMLEQVRRAVQDRLITEVELPAAEKRFAVERYYAPAVPVIRQPDRDLLDSPCRAIANGMAATLRDNWADLHATFAMTHLARDGWTVDDLWPYLQEVIARLAVERIDSIRPVPEPAHGLAWVEDLDEFDRPEPSATTLEEEIA